MNHKSSSSSLLSSTVEFQPETRPMGDCLPSSNKWPIEGHLETMAVAQSNKLITQHFQPKDKTKSNHDQLVCDSANELDAPSIPALIVSSVATPKQYVVSGCGSATMQDKIMNSSLTSEKANFHYEKGYKEHHSPGSIKSIDSTRRGADQKCYNAQKQPSIELRFLIRRREAGAIIGKRGTNIKRLRDSYQDSIFCLPDTGNGPERVICITTNSDSIELILYDLAKMLMEKSPEKEDQLEIKLLIHSSHAGSLIGIRGDTIKKLRNVSLIFQQHLSSRVSLPS